MEFYDRAADGSVEVIMKLNVVHCPENIKILVEELRKQIHLEIGEDGFKLTVTKRMELGFAIEKRAGELEIQYGSLPDLCRAILTACSRKDEPYSYQEKPFCKEVGVMLDCSRNAVIRVEQLKKYIRILALMGYSYIGLYMEDTIAVKEESYLGYMRGAITPEELREADAYALAFGMEIRAYIQTLAHLNQITRYQEYENIIDCNDILLAGEERTYEFLECIIKTVSENLTSRKVNIGMDEAHMVGLGKYLDEHGFSKRFDIMEKHLERVLSITRKYSLEAEMWSDMFFRLAYGGQYYVENQEMEYTPNIPEDVKLVYWDYYSVDTEHYASMFSQHKKLTTNIGFAGGAWKWTGFAPHNRYSLSIGKAALEACRKHNISSVVITAWGDDGAEASPFSILPALYSDAEYIYADTDAASGSMDKAKFEVLTGITFDQFMAIDAVNLPVDKEQDINNASKFLLYNDPFIGTFDSVISDGITDYYKETSDKLAKLIDNQEFGYMFRAMSALCKVLSEKADLGVRIRKAYTSGDREILAEIADGTIPSIIQNLEVFLEAFEEQWRIDNKTFGFEVQCIRIGGLKQRLQYARDMLHRYLQKEITQIDELAVNYLPYAYWDIDNIKELNYNLWKNIVTPSVMG
ncbi:MAG TPA: beta-N-acetylhexosaminidase [Mobilitalea sp.]|nr:beta-N-acetylhexosaminidase [Mobilitalea sp.]